MARINNVTRRKQSDGGHIKSRACLAATGAAISHVTHGIATHIPQAARDGFEAGRRDGQDFVTGPPYAAGATVGFAFGASQAIVGVLATPVNSLVRLGRLGDWPRQPGAARDRRRDRSLVARCVTNEHLTKPAWGRKSFGS